MANRITETLARSAKWKRNPYFHKICNSRFEEQNIEVSHIHPSARFDLEDATFYYADISPELAEKFLNDFEQTLSFIEAMPLAWAAHYLDLRKLNFKIFPYSIVYTFSEASREVTIVAVQHQSRKPFYWKDRV